MVRSAFAVLFAGCLLSAPNCLAQGESAVPFLLVSPSARVTGMGEASVALCTDDPLAPITNPAHIGMQSQTSYFSFGHNYCDWMPGLGDPNLWWKTFAFNAGIDLKQQFGITPEMSLGFGYSRVYLNLGPSFTSDLAGPVQTGTFNAYESSDQYTFGAGINSWVRASAGVTFKHVVSELANFNVQGHGKVAKATVDSYDYGLLIDVPFAGILARLRGEPVEVLPHLSPFFDVSTGFAKNNLGDKRVTYIDPAQADPLPRYARIGIGFDLGMAYDIEGTEWRPVSFAWTTEQNDVLVRRYPEVMDSSGNVVRQSTWEYTAGLGDINVLDDVILGHSGPGTIKKKGWEINILEVFSMRGGRYEQCGDKSTWGYATSGYGFRLAGIVKLLRVMRIHPAPGGVLGFILTHTDVRYDHSALTTDDRNDALANTKFDSIDIHISN